MRIFNIKVNGKEYNVEVEEIKAGSQEKTASTQEAIAPAPASKTAPTPTQAPVVKAIKPTSVEGGTPVKSPMPGLILRTLVADGATVKKNDKIIVLEAMKMENDILASADGTVYFTVKKGDSVETGAVLATVK